MSYPCFGTVLVIVVKLRLPYKYSRRVSCALMRSLRSLQWLISFLIILRFSRGYYLCTSGQHPSYDLIRSLVNLFRSGLRSRPPCWMNNIHSLEDCRALQNFRNDLTKSLVNLSPSCQYHSLKIVIKRNLSMQLPLGKCRHYHGILVSKQFRHLNLSSMKMKS